MMIKARHTYQWLWGCLLTGFILLFVACADDDTEEPQGGTLRLSSVTRQGETTPEVVTEGAIRLFIATADNYTSGSFNGAVDQTDPTKTIWTNHGAVVKENTQYYIYGYMPHDNSVVSNTSSIAKPAGGDYSDGAIMTLSGLSVLTSEDICVIVGVGDATATAAQGVYGYTSGIAGENPVNLLMGHLYTQLQLRFCVDKDYYALRRIHLKTVTIKSTYVAKDEKVTATVNLAAGSGLSADRVSFSDPAATRPSTPESFPLLTDGDLNLAVAPDYTELSNTVNCPYRIFDGDGTYLSLECTYDVYESATNLKIRENCTSVNKIKVDSQAPGMKKVLTLTVEPTYLYVLADPDLDNPTIHVN